MKTKALTVIVLILLWPALSLAASVSLIWDPVIHPDLAGYRMFYREKAKSYDYLKPVWTGTEITCTVTGLSTDTTRYCFVVRAYSVFAQESDNSNEVCWPRAGIPSPLLQFGTNSAGGAP